MPQEISHTPESPTPGCFLILTDTYTGSLTCPGKISVVMSLLSVFSSDGVVSYWAAMLVNVSRSET